MTVILEVGVRGGSGGKKRRRRPSMLSGLLYTPLESEEELRKLEGKVRRSRAGFYSHLASWAGVSTFLTLMYFTVHIEDPGGAGRFWVLFPILGWGMAVAGHAARVLVAHPRALAIHHAVFARSAARRPGESRDPAALKAEIARLVEEVRDRVKALDPPRVDLEAVLEVAHRESQSLVSELERLEGSVASARIGPASRDRVETLVAERDRVRLALESFRVTLGNLEVDALLLAGSAAPSGFSFDSLKTEGELLRAAVEGARQARETLLDRGRA